MADHRVPLLRLPRRDDPARSRDPRIRSVVSGLADLRLAPAPDPVFRSELRAQLVAIAPRIVAEGAAATPAARERPRTASTTGTTAGERTRRRIPIMRPLRIVTAVLTVFGLLLGGAVWMSRKALPGDNLYGLKRAGEQVQLALAGSDRARAADRLGFAQDRVDEVKALWTQATTTASGAGPQAAAGPNQQTSRLITTTLAAADADVTDAAALLNRDAVRSGSSAPLQTMTTWAKGQGERLGFLVDHMPPGSAVHRSATSSSSVVDKAEARASALGKDLGEPCLKQTPADQYGPKPCATATRKAPRRTGGTSPSTRGGSTGGAHPSGTKNPRRSTPAGTTRTTAPPRPKASGSPTPSSKTPTVPLPLPKPSLPKVSVGKNCISVSIIGVDLKIGCGSTG